METVGQFEHSGHRRRAKAQALAEHTLARRRRRPHAADLEVELAVVPR